MGLIFRKAVKNQGCVQVYGLVKCMVSTAEAPDFYQSRLGRQLLELLLVRSVTTTHGTYSSEPVGSHVLYEMNLGVQSPMTKQIIAYPYFALRNDGLGHEFQVYT